MLAEQVARAGDAVSRQVRHISELATPNPDKVAADALD
jgi:hypothetical protein